MSEREAKAYREVRARTTELVRAAPAEAMEAIAPATPDWRVRDVLAHLVGVTADVAEGRLEGVATDPWTAVQVDARRERSVDEMLTEWDDYGARFEVALVDLPTALGGQAVFDAITHEQDIRHALDTPGGRDSDAVAIAFEFCCGARTNMGVPAMRVVTEAGEVIAGTGEPFVTLETTQFEFIRAFSGRRSPDEIAKYEWSSPVDPETILGAPIFTLRATSLRE
jgi:uncharacterized protein (TIGR03083 family)